MKSKTQKTVKIFVAIFATLLFSATTAFSQGINWKLTLNNNVGTNDGIGSKNYADLKFFTNNKNWMTLNKDGALQVDLIKGLKHSLVLAIGPQRIDYDNPLNQTITFGADASTGYPYSQIKVGIGKTNPGYTLDVNDDINVTPSAANKGYRIGGAVVLQKPGTQNTFPV